MDIEAFDHVDQWLGQPIGLEIDDERDLGKGNDGFLEGRDPNLPPSERMPVDAEMTMPCIQPGQVVEK